MHRQQKNKFSRKTLARSSVHRRRVRYNKAATNIQAGYRGRVSEMLSEECVRGWSDTPPASSTRTSGTVACASNPFGN